MPTSQLTRHARQAWLRVLSCAAPNELATLLHPFVVSTVALRSPEVGLAMVAARVGATGDAFGLGEMTITRCVLQVGDNVGVGYVRGRAPRHAEHVALADALLQGDRHDELMADVVVPLAQRQSDREAQRADEADTSRVQFLTMVRGN